MSSQDKIAVVTGALGGIGTAICQRLAAEGATVVGTYHPAEADKVDAWKEAQGGNVDVAGGDGMHLGTLPVPLPEKTAHDLAQAGPGTYTLGARPEHLTLGAEGLAGEVTVVEELGSEAFVFVKVTHQGETLQLVVRDEGETAVQRGDTVHVGFKGPVHVFASSGERIGD